MNEHTSENGAPRKPTAEEAEAILTLVRGGWLRLELTLDEAVIPPVETGVPDGEG